MSVGPIASLLKNQKDAEPGNQGVEAQAFENEKDILSDFSDSFAVLADQVDDADDTDEADDGLPIFESINANPSVANVPTLDGSTIEKKVSKNSKKLASKKPRLSKRMLKSAGKQPAAASEMPSELPTTTSSSVEVPPTETGARPRRIQKITTHSNPYSRNTKGFIPPLDE
jgi:hypothetical protein